MQSCASNAARTISNWSSICLLACGSASNFFPQPPQTAITTLSFSKSEKLRTRCGVVMRKRQYGRKFAGKKLAPNEGAAERQVTPACTGVCRAHHHCRTPTRRLLRFGEIELHMALLRYVRPRTSPHIRLKVAHYIVVFGKWQSGRV